MKTRRDYVCIHIVLTILVTVMLVALVVTEPTVANIAFAVVVVPGFWFLSPIPNMLRRERKGSR